MAAGMNLQVQEEWLNVEEKKWTATDELVMLVVTPWNKEQVQEVEIWYTLVEEKKKVEMDE